MKHRYINIIFFTLVLLFSGCSEPIDPEGSEGDSCTIESTFTQSNGSKLTSSFFRNHDGFETHKSYFYNDNDQLILIKHESSQHETRFEYDGELLLEKKYGDFENGDFIKTTYEYNEDNFLKNIFVFRPDTVEHMDIEVVYEIETNDEGFATSNIEYRTEDPTDKFKTNIFWENGNISRIEVYHPEDLLNYERIYYYDEGINYNKLTKSGLFSGLNLSKNNRIGLRNIYHNGQSLDPCDDCCNAHEYNLDNYPTIIETNIGSHFFQYE